MTGAIPVRTGAERATLVRRTYLLVLASVLVTMGGVSFAMSTPPVLNWAARHPIITMLGMFVPLIGAMKFRQVFPTNIGIVFLFTFIEGIAIAPLIYLYNQMQPGIVGQAALLTGTTFGVLTAYAFVSRKDFSAWGGFSSACGS
jgi:FtsH-binding integral membrane protein